MLHSSAYIPCNERWRNGHYPISSLLQPFGTTRDSDCGCNTWDLRQGAGDLNGYYVCMKRRCSRQEYITESASVLIPLICSTAH
jgi:hypothetical protein